MKNIIILGATGGIGDSVLSVIRQNKKNSIFLVSHLAKHEVSKNIINEFKPKYIFTDSSESYNYLIHAFEKDAELNIFEINLVENF